MQALVDDDLVHQDKIGISNFFWAFPSEAAVRVCITLATMITCTLVIDDPCIWQAPTVRADDAGAERREQI